MSHEKIINWLIRTQKTKSSLEHMREKIIDLSEICSHYLCNIFSEKRPISTRSRAHKQFWGKSMIFEWHGSLKGFTIFHVCGENIYCISDFSMIQFVHRLQFRFSSGERESLIVMQFFTHLQIFPTLHCTQPQIEWKLTENDRGRSENAIKYKFSWIELLCCGINFGLTHNLASSQIMIRVKSMSRFFLCSVEVFFSLIELFKLRNSVCDF